MIPALLDSVSVTEELGSMNGRFDSSFERDVYLCFELLFVTQNAGPIGHQTSAFITDDWIIVYPEDTPIIRYNGNSTYDYYYKHRDGFASTQYSDEKKETIEFYIDMMDRKT